MAMHHTSVKTPQRPVTFKSSHRAYWTLLVLTISNYTNIAVSQGLKITLPFLILSRNSGVISLHTDPHLIAHPVCQWACNGSWGSAALRWQGEIWLYRIYAFYAFTVQFTHQRPQMNSYMSRPYETMAIYEPNVILQEIYDIAFGLILVC